MKNAFGDCIPAIKDLLGDTYVRHYVDHALSTVLKILGASGGLAPRIIHLAEREADVNEYELAAHSMLAANGVTPARVTSTLDGRAELVYSQIRPFIKPGSLLDLGCGDGKVGKRISASGIEVVLADICRHPQIDVHDLEFIQFGQGQNVPDNSMYDNVLILTVLHHSDNPIRTLESAKERTKEGGNIVVIESVYGIDNAITEPLYGEDSGAISENFKALTHEQQRLANIFFDHFYNRVIHFSADPAKKVNVPFNFRRPQEWAAVFSEMGLKQVAFEYLGIDQPSVPEYHTLHVLRNGIR